MRVVLATGPRAIGDIERGGLPFLGIAYIAAALEQKGHEVFFIDAHTFFYNPKKAAAEILKFNPEVIGFTATSHNRLQAIDLIREVKKINPEVKIMVGGPHFSLTAVNALENVPEIDFIVKREGDITVQELLASGFEQNRLKEILGLIFRNEKGEIVDNPDRPFIKNLDDLPMAAWHIFDLSKYQGTSVEKTRMKTIGVISSRGCPNFCVFCCNAAYSRSTLRLRSPKNFVDEVEFLNKKYGYRAFNFWDDTLTIVRSHVEDICNEILNRKLDIIWYARARVNTVDRPMLDLMKKAGCVRINFGVESGSPKILKLIKKNITLEQVFKAVNDSVAAGMEVTTNFMVNLPYETDEDTQMTIKVIRELSKIPNVSASYGFSLAYPKTEMEEIAQKEGYMPKNFSWNTSYKTKKYKIIGEDPSLPYMEWKGREIEKVKAMMVRGLAGSGGLAKKLIWKIKKIRNFSEFKTLAKAGFRVVFDK